MSYTHLSLEERYVIYHLVLYGLSLREIGRRLNRNHMTISREIKRNRPTYADDAVYWHEAAQEYADHRKRLPRHCIRQGLRGRIKLINLRFNQRVFFGHCQPLATDNRFTNRCY